MDVINVIQAEHKVWARKNFGPPEDRNPLHPILGVGEETGELMHAVLKRDQKIRGTPLKHTMEMHDAIGDIVIFLMDICNQEGVELTDVVYDTWQGVKQRDWTTERIRNAFTRKAKASDSAPA